MLSNRKLSTFNIKSFKWPNLKNKWSDGNYLVIPSWGNFPEWVKLEKCKYSHSLEWNEDRILKSDDLLFNTWWVWTLWRVWIFKESKIKSVPDWFILVLRNEDSELITKYLFYYFQSIEAKKLIRKYTRWTTWITSIKPTDIFSFDVPCFNITIQNLIVSEIEKQFSRLDEWLSSLLRIRENLRSYRASLLKSAVECRLTANWRAEHPDIESADMLLDRIRTVRREKWLSENQGKSYKTQKISNIITSSELPSNWVQDSFEAIFEVFVWSTPSRGKKEYWNGDINWASSWEVKFNEIFDTIEKITEEWLNNCSTKIHPPWTIMMWMIWEWKTRGQCAILRCNACHNQNTAAIRVNEDFILSKYVYYFLSKNYENIRKIWWGGNQKALNKRFIEAMIFTLPPLTEQVRIVEILEEKFSVIDALESLVNANIRRAENLKQSILKKAFSGELIIE